MGEQNSLDKSEIARLNGVIDTLRSELATAKAQADTLRSQLDAANTSVDNLNTQLNTAKSQIQSLESRLNNPREGEELRQLRIQLSDCERYRNELAEFNAKASQ